MATSSDDEDAVRQHWPVADAVAITVRRMHSPNLNDTFTHCLQRIPENTTDPFYMAVNRLIAMDATTFSNNENPLLPTTIASIEQIVMGLIAIPSYNRVDRVMLYRLYTQYAVCTETPFSEYLRAYLESIMKQYKV